MGNAVGFSFFFFFFCCSAFTESYNKAMQQGIGIRRRSRERWTSYPRISLLTGDLEEDKGRQEGLWQVSGLVQPLGSFRSFAGVYIHSLFAVFTLNRAAPFKLAFALGDALHTRCIVPPSTAHHFTAICPSRRFVADATGCAQRTLTTKWHIKFF